MKHIPHITATAAPARWILLAALYMIVALAATPQTVRAGSSGSRPHFSSLGPIRCVEAGKSYRDSLSVQDSDLVDQSKHEVLHVTVLEPRSGFSVTPQTITGPLSGSSSSGEVLIYITCAPVPQSAGRLRIVLLVSDSQGNADTARYYISVSEPLLFAMSFSVHNTDVGQGSNAAQTLTFGMGQHATTGAELSWRGNLDSNYCEYELPPAPPPPVFDARWTIPTRNGVLRNIYPWDPSAEFGSAPVWFAAFNAGGSLGSELQPVVIAWNRNDAYRCSHDLYFEDPLWNENLRSGAFKVSMKTGQFQTVPGVDVQRSNDSITVTIYTPAITGFKIVMDQMSGVDDHVAPAPAAWLTCSPNPFAESTTVTFTLAEQDRPRIEIYDAGARYVRSLFNGPAQRGDHTLQWDGTDDQGRPCPAGAYHCRMWSRAGAVTVGLRIVR